MNKRVGIDVDDVLADFVATFVSICHRRYGTPLTTRPVDWGWSNFGLTDEQIDAVWKEINSTEYFWYNVPPVATARNLCLLYHSAVKLFFITKRKDTGRVMNAEEQTAAWLRDFFGIVYPVVLANTPKGLTAKALELTHFIDDRPENCIDVLEHVPSCEVFIKDTTHNQQFFHPQIQRVSTFDEFANIIGEKN